MPATLRSGGAFCVHVMHANPPPGHPRHAECRTSAAGPQAGRRGAAASRGGTGGRCACSALYVFCPNVPVGVMCTVCCVFCVLCPYLPVGMMCPVCGVCVCSVLRCIVRITQGGLEMLLFYPYVAVGAVCHSSHCL